MHDRHKGGSRGIALVSVLLLVAILTMIAVSVIGTARVRSQLVGRQTESIQALELLDSAIRVTILELAFPPNAQALTGAGVHAQRIVSIAEHDVAVNLALETDRVDLNYADAQTLAALLEANDYTETEALAFAARIIDWRDVDDVTTRFGAERGAYTQAGLAYGPRNGPFESVGELRRALGLANLSDAVLDGFTVYSHTPLPLDSSAVPAVQQALRSLAAHRGQHDPTQGGATSGGDGAMNSGQSFSPVGHALRVRACPATSASAACRVAIGLFTGSTAHPYISYLWETQYAGDAGKRP